MNVPEMRKGQEELENLLTGGYYKTVIKLHTAVFDEYVLNKFTREEALKMTIEFFRPKNNSDNT